VTGKSNVRPQEDRTAKRIKEGEFRWKWRSFSDILKGEEVSFSRLDFSFYESRLVHSFISALSIYFSENVISFYRVYEHRM
jgi:hypothetical protein